VVFRVVGLNVVGDFGDKAGWFVSRWLRRLLLSMASDLRFKTNKIRHSVHLIALAIRLGPDLADLVEEVHALEPFFGCEVNLSCEVVQVANCRGVDFLEAWAGVWAACVDNVLCEVLVVLVGGRGSTGLRLGRHCIVSVLCVRVVVVGVVSI